METFLPASKWRKSTFCESASCGIGATKLTATVCGYLPPGERGEGGAQAERKQGGSAVTSLAIKDGSVAVRGADGAERCPTDFTDMWLLPTAKGLAQTPRDYTRELVTSHGMPPQLGFARSFKLVESAEEVRTAPRSFASRYTSIPEQLKLQKGLIAIGQRLRAEDGEDGDLAEIANVLNNKPLLLNLVKELQAVVAGSGAYVSPAKRLAEMRRTLEADAPLDGVARLEVFDWARSALALALRPADGFVGNTSQQPLSFSDAVMSNAQLYPALLGWLPKKDQPSRSAKEAEALRVATAALWQLLRTQIDEELAAAVAASGGCDYRCGAAVEPGAEPTVAAAKRAVVVAAAEPDRKQQRTAEPVVADAEMPSPET